MVNDMKKSYRSRARKQELWEKNPYCSLCSERIEKLADASWDHIIARSKGGPDKPHNLALAHVWCNGEKDDLSPWVYRFFRFLNQSLFKVRPGRPSKRLSSRDPGEDS